MMKKSMMNSGMENKESMRGMTQMRGQSSMGKIADMERVGGKMEGSHSFRMPKEVVDHSMVRSPEKY